METIQAIVEAHGYDSVQDMDVGDMVEVELGEAMMPLVIEKIGDNRLSVMHYRKQRGDMMRDPEIVFHVSEPGDWTPIEYVQDPGVYQRNENGLYEAEDLAQRWDQNLDTQGYVDTAKEQVVRQ